MNVRLMIEAQKVNAVGLTKIYVEVSFRDNSKKLHMLRLATGEKTIPDAWGGQRVSAKHGEGYKALNKRIKLKEAEVLEYISQHPKVTLYQIKEHFTVKRQVQHLTFFGLFEQFISFQETKVKAASLKPTRTTLTELKTIFGYFGDTVPIISEDIVPLSKGKNNDII